VALKISMYIQDEAFVKRVNRLIAPGNQTKAAILINQVEYSARDNLQQFLTSYDQNKLKSFDFISGMFRSNPGIIYNATEMLLTPPTKLDYLSLEKTGKI